MSRTGWKRAEREAAKILGGTRYPANQGGPVDCEAEGWVTQVKQRKTLSLAALEALLLEIDRVALQKNKHGVVMVKRSAGRGRTTPWLLVISEGTWKEMNGRLPMEPTA